MAVGPQVEFPVAKQPIDVLQRQFSFSAFACDVQYSFGVLHYAYLPVVFRRNHLPSFAMYRAFPGSDYYEGSVAIGVSPRRQSRVPFDFGDWASLVFTYIHQRSTAIKTALVVLVVVVGFALVVTLATPVSFLVLNRFGLAETWVVGALFSSFILFWSVVLFMGLVLAAVVVVGWRILKVRCVTFGSDGGSRG